MSETQTQTPQPEYVPQHVLEAETNEDATQPLQPPQDAPQSPPDGAEAKPEAAPDPEEERRSERRREAARIGYLTKQRYQEKARADALEQRLREFEQHIAQQSGQQRQPSQQDLDAEINRRAAAMVQAQQHNDKFNTWEQDGVKELGTTTDAFRDASKTVAEMVDPARMPALVEVLMDTPGGQRAVMAMAADAAEAERILSLPPHRMALEIARLGAPPEAPKPRATSNLPPPIRPPASRGAAVPDPERGDMSSFLRWSATQSWRR